MADILIRMEMPQSCSDCPMCYDQMECTVRLIKFWWEELPMDFCNERHPACPLVELPEHGDLIDRDDIVEHYRKAECNLGSDKHLEFLTVHDWIEDVFVYDLLNVPSVVPANNERSEDA